MATLEQIQARMKKLQAQAEVLLAKRAQAAVDQIRELMIKHGLTTVDIEARAKARREAKVAGRRLSNGAASAKGKMPPKYRDPKTGATWSGHARPPAWIKNVKDRTRFLIDGAAAIALNGSGASHATTAARKVSAKKAAAKKAPAKKATAKKAVAKKAVTKKVATRKVATKKTAAKKPAARKTAVKKTVARKVSTAKRAPARKAAAKKAAPSAAA
ncbi:H-NS histone family protein [Paraburkholderia phenazinium]|jgi:DNA-binding protein H-NS|uniref:DNA-binding protein H-NS n=1 Tax=Paraburkholderia phenazinium TaxID=60549 RepID=A0A1N6GM71_9BURK|nr:H-NS histone family protein [Paraburkholderia phenazinium]SIO08618.1 DNA-binding protein H-NS [Paraburkholderia phenazinium]